MQTVTVDNVAPEITLFSVTTPVNENGMAVGIRRSRYSTFTVIDCGNGDDHQSRRWRDLAADDSSVSRRQSDAHSATTTPAVTDDDTGSDIADGHRQQRRPSVGAQFAINENGVATLSGNVSDVDTFTLEIDWGDPLSPDDMQSFSLGAAALTEGADGISWDPVTGNFSLTHQYLDDNPTSTASDNYTVNVTVTDDDTGNDMAMQTVTVDNVAPEITFFNVFPSPLDEGGGVTLQLAFDDPGTLDNHTVDIDWGDGSGIETINLGDGELSLVTSHIYLDDNPTGDPTNDYTVTVTVDDDDTGGASAMQTVTVDNVAPEITLFSVTTPVNENGIATLQLAFDDPGILDTFTVDIDWGDGTAIETINLGAGETSLQTTHQYLDDNPTGTLSDDYTVTVTVTDDDTGSDMAMQTVTVNNVDPVLVLNPITAINENGVATLSGNVSDVGTLDTFTLEIDWGDPLSPDDMQSFSLGAAALTEGADGISWDPVTGNFSLTHQYLR